MRPVARLLASSLAPSVLAALAACGGAAPPPAGGPVGPEASAVRAQPAAEPRSPATPSAPGGAAGSGVTAAPSATPAKDDGPPPVTSVRLTVENACATAVAYCVEDGDTLSTSLAGRASTTHDVKPGARIRMRSGAACGEPVHTVSAASREARFVVCAR